MYLIGFLRHQAPCALPTSVLADPRAFTVGEISMGGDVTPVPGRALFVSGAASGLIGA